MGYFEIIIAFLSLLVCLCSFRNNNGLPTNWPLVGMLPALLINLHRINDFVVELVENSQMTFLFKGPWFTKMKLLITVNPTNVHHIMSKNFGNYPKGSKFNEIFDILGGGIFNADAELWQYHRKMAQSFLGRPHFHQLLMNNIWDKVENGLVPVLDHVSKQGIVLDLQDLFERFTFDTICTLIMDHDPRSLSIDWPSVPPSKALNDVEEVILYRHAVPSRGNKHEEFDVDMLTLYMDASGIVTPRDGDKFLRDTILNFLIAGRDTTSSALSWFFYLLSKNPQVLSKIKEELDVMVKQQATKDDGKRQYTYLSRHFEEISDKLVYLHGALCEALRLYPPVVFEAKTPIEPDILPSGHQVDSNTQIIFNLYAMARMKSIWGDDCCEFKPERWISEKGKIRHEPSYKFLAFNAGPRTCVGKNMAFIQMKIVAATIIQNYHIQEVEGCPVVPDISIILHMKHGFKVKVLPL